jgi:transketolase
VVEFKSTRAALGDALIELADSGVDIAAVAADTSKSMYTEILGKKYPERSFDFGIAEQNMMMIAAGLAASGKVVFAASYSVFTSMRVTEQLRTFICYPKLNVNVFAGIGGLSGGIEGATHMALEDLGIVRCLPNLTVLNPADYYATKKAVLEAAKIDGPCYIRVGRDASPVIFDDSYRLSIGRANTIIDEGNDIGIIVSGIILHHALEVTKKLKMDGYGVKLIEMPTLKPIDSKAVIDMAGEVKYLFTVEEHNFTGGLNTAVCEVLCRSFPVKVYPIAAADIYGESGSPSELAAKYRLDGQGIYQRIREVIGKK